MTARIKREFNFIAGIWLHDEYQIGMYSFTMFIDIMTEEPYEQSIALERMKYFVDECITNSVFIEASEKKVIDTFTNLGMKVCVLPVEPYDQSLAIPLLLKLNAITEGKFTITNMSFKSQLSDDVEYLIDIEDEFEPFNNKNSWWNDSGSNISDNKKTNKKDKIVKLHKDNEWAELDLGWKHTCKPEASEIIFTLDTVK
jgi:hypothetical protein